MMITAAEIDEHPILTEDDRRVCKMMCRVPDFTILDYARSLMDQCHHVDTLLPASIGEPAYLRKFHHAACLYTYEAFKRHDGYSDLLLLPRLIALEGCDPCRP